MLRESIEERIADAREEFNLLAGRHHFDSSPAYRRLIERAKKRISDLEAVRDGKAVQVWATACVDRRGAWAARGMNDFDELEDELLNPIRDPGDRLTVARFIAYLPVATTDETDAESEEM